MIRIALVTLAISLSGWLAGQNIDQTIPPDMVLIPGGTYLIGSNDHQRIAAPLHQVKLSSYYMDSHEVTNKEYHDFCMKSGYMLLSSKCLRSV